MNIIFAGNNIRALKCLEFLLKKKLNIILSIGHPKKKTDKYYFRSIEELSRRNNINFIKPKTLNTQKIYNKIESTKVKMQSPKFLVLKLTLHLILAEILKENLSRPN